MKNFSRNLQEMKKTRFNTLEEAINYSTAQKKRVKAENKKQEIYLCESCNEKLSYRELFFGKKCLLCARKK